ncbi:MAG: methyl-accepting chemotaxis protein [Algicola sp.]|nr:methyl-accepting chemotaxis protein [Algicola sp.]
MKLNFKVVHKIYMGFGVIVGLLIASSVISDKNLDDISQSTVQVNEVAVPVLKQSNQLQIDLLKQAKLSTLSFNHSTLEQIAESLQQFRQSTAQFEKNYQQLNKLVSGGAISPKRLNDAHDSYQQYNRAVESMLGAVKARIELTTTLRKTHEELNVVLDAGGAVLMEFAEITEGDAAVLSLITGTADYLDGHVYKFFSTADQIVVMSDPDKVATSKQDVGFAVSDINAQITYLQSVATQIDDRGLMGQFKLEWAKITDLLQGENSLLNVKMAQLTELNNAATQLALAEKHVNQASVDLDELLKQTDEQFNALQQQVLANVVGGQGQLRSVMVVLTIIAVFMALLTTQAILKPLKGINQVLKYMAQGDLSRKLDVKSDDEFGQLSGNINNVVSDLTSLVQQIVQSSTKLTSNLSTVVENSTKDILKMSDFVEQQRVKVDEVNQITVSMNDSTGHVSKQANDAVAQMVEAQAQSQRIDTIAQTNNQLIGDLASKLDQTTVNIDKLQAESQLIGGIVEAIRSIAEQTNLLALNAAIEAARAGEQGRGFAVVADEVRSLAVRTSSATTEIRTMIENLQGQIGEAVNDITTGKQQATECVKYTDELTQSLAVITSAIVQIHDMNAEIADSAQQQQQQSNQIKDKVSDVLVIAEQNAEISRSTLEHSNQIASLADELDRSVHEFKV